MADGLAELGWAEAPRGRAWEEAQTARELWTLLAAQSGGSLAFEADAFWSADWDSARRKEAADACMQRLRAGELDLVIALGTWAGQDLANDDHAVPVVVVSASDPVASGIVPSASDPGRDHVYAPCETAKYARQVRTFHRIVGFERLGVVYENSPDGRVWANLADLRAVARQRGFTLVEAHVRDTDVSPEEARDDVARAYTSLAPRVDALWLSTLLGEDPRFLPGLLEPMFEHGVPTWGQLGPRQVRRGVLFSIAERDFRAIGHTYARAAAAMLNGASARDLPLTVEDPKSLVLNLAVARRIGYDVPPGLVRVAAHAYDSIESGPYPAGSGQ
jgi:ABC-type uncharacterized transport system substrate-binding protein